jgi:hypothetical protein
MGVMIATLWGGSPVYAEEERMTITTKSCPKLLGIVFAAQSNPEFVDNSPRTLRIQSEAPLKVEAPRTAVSN